MASYYSDLAQIDGGLTAADMAADTDYGNRGVTTPAPDVPATPAKPATPATPAPVIPPFQPTSGLTQADLDAALAKQQAGFDKALADLSASNANQAAATQAAADQKAAADKAIKTQNAQQLLASTLQGYNIENTANGTPISTAIMTLLQKNYDAPTIQALIEDPASAKSSDPAVAALATAWNTRFAGNVQRIANGQNPLSPAEYIATENSYNNIAQAAGLPAGFMAAHVADLIGNNVAPTEVQDRVNLAAKSIANQDPFYSNTLQNYYGITPGDMIAHALNPTVALPLLQRQTAAATFGAAGARQNINVDQNTAAQYAALGVTQSQAEQGFQSVAQALPTEQKLAAIYGGTGTQFGAAGQQQANLTAAQFGGAGGAQAEAQLKKLQQQEVNAFSGSSGVDKNSLFGSTSGTF